ncbi:ferrochelatase [Kordiimonas sp. SCSIO 12610]|uniref:ferrochelatase n=1 Tax=Kordiimonas sp. SCSIO 12610 TaxID=2829597 RepID=UPI002109E7DC|nr:ferrochelatase [Kordiimonas sp. SCSIO 12610]UTW55170.1 ferrochelatase [Kordiimonas sp. SCSIO 12610]
MDHFPAKHPSVSHGKTGLLMISLGTPDAPTYRALRRYLAEFLSDPRVIEVPRLLWLPILYGPLLTFRPGKSAKAYAKIWNNDRNESPLRTISRDQADKMRERFNDDVLEIEWAFRYGNPSIETGLHSLKEKGCDRILVFALYPQYSATTVASSYDKVFEILGKMRWQPAIRTTPAYHDNPGFIDALANSVSSELASLDWEPEHILASYHSIPKAYFDKGDPYPCHCWKTSRLLNEKLSLPEGKLISSFQSRVGPTEWVGPYSDKTVEDLGQKGIKKLAVLAPAFSADCVETLEEINLELRETFFENGGTHFHYIPCLNASHDGMNVLEAIVRNELQGWI